MMEKMITTETQLLLRDTDVLSGELKGDCWRAITSDECTEILNHNGTSSRIIKSRVDENLPAGMTPGMLCGLGIQSEIDGRFRFSGACKGDSGGPLKIKNRNNDDRETLVGIIAGGVGCGSGVPNWFTKVSFYRDWML